MKIFQEPEVAKTKPAIISGEVLFCGGTNWDLTGRRAVPKGGLYLY